jgi:UDP-3-O-[3-hydroxymyristoyl] glucosamine N-acyltransferase
MKINNHTIAGILKRTIIDEFECQTLGLVNTPSPSTLSFLDTEEFLIELQQNRNITVVLSRKEFSDEVKAAGKIVLISDDPRYDFFSIHNVIASENYKRWPSQVHPSATIDPHAFIADHNVLIGAETHIEPNATILPDVELGERCIIRAGAVLGTEGFEHKRTSRGILSVRHDGRAILRNDIEVGSGSCIAKGFSFRNTIIDDSTKIDNLVQIAHGVQIGKRCMLPGCVMIAGSVTIGDEVWIGPNATISNGITIGNKATITLGSIVITSVKEGEYVTGTFSLPRRNSS